MLIGFPAEDDSRLDIQLRFRKELADPIVYHLGPGALIDVRAVDIGWMPVQNVISLVVVSTVDRGRRILENLDSSVRLQDALQFVLVEAVGKAFADRNQIRRI